MMKGYCDLLRRWAEVRRWVVLSHCAGYCKVVPLSRGLVSSGPGFLLAACQLDHLVAARVVLSHCAGYRQVVPLSRGLVTLGPGILLAACQSDQLVAARAYIFPTKAQLHAILERVISLLILFILI